MHGVAAEIPKEIVVLFEDGDLDTATSQQIAEHHAGRSTADDAAGVLYDLRRHVTSLLFRVSLICTSDARTFTANTAPGKTRSKLRDLISQLRRDRNRRNYGGARKCF